MSRLLFVLSAVFALSCSEDRPTQTDPQTEAAALGDLVSINGAAYRRVAAKPAATQKDYSITITIPLKTSADGTVYLSETITIGNRVYRSNCDAPTQSTQDDVGNTMSEATDLTVPLPESAEQGTFWASPMYQLTPGDIDVFRLRIPEFLTVGVTSGPDGNTTDTAGRLVTTSGRVIDENDNHEHLAPNFMVFGFGVSPGVLYLEVSGAQATTSGPYSLLIGTWEMPAGKPVASQVADLERRLTLQMRGE